MLQFWWINSFHLQFLVLLALLALAFAEEVKKEEEKKPDDKAKPKRGLIGLGYGYSDFNTYAAVPAFSTYQLSEPSTHTHTVITKEVAVPVPQPVAVPIEKHVPYAVKVNYSNS